MRFAVIEGSREWTEPNRRGGPAAPMAVSVEDVEAEARRRLKCIKLDEWRTREFITGRPMPEDVQQQAMQIDFAARAIARLSPIPDDFDNDVYWPRTWA